MDTLRSYLLATRPKTLPAAIVPVWVGCALAWKMTGGIDPRLALFTVLSALCIQVATNLFNDVIDDQKGADTAGRLGPQRVTGSGLLSRRAVYLGAFVFIGLACVCSVPLIEARGWTIIAIGIPSLYLAYGYTGGPFPLAYLGLGEVFVVLFFGLVAVGGTFFVQTGMWSWPAGALGLQVGMLSAVLIAINNLRDVEEDRRSGKKTLAVRFGSTSLGVLNWIFVTGAFLLGFLGPQYGASWMPICSLSWLGLGIWCAAGTRRAPPGRRYNRYLAGAALQLVLFAGAFTAAVVI
ncbi:MAG: 1,4-dihydroxy-2-naphthoate octaprenyltransferase [Verrucomicrobiaceae bacterium]|nr:1,4-dihydroxy-2-naphthoate octaprenyltransferase [Verrucomicrobiaceae bacterium]